MCVSLFVWWREGGGGYLGGRWRRGRGTTLAHGRGVVTDPVCSHVNSSRVCDIVCALLSCASEDGNVCISMSVCTNE